MLLAVVETPGLSHFGCRPLGPIALGQAALATGAATAAAAAIARIESRGTRAPARRRRERTVPRRAPITLPAIVTDDDGPVLFGGLAA